MIANLFANMSLVVPQSMKEKILSDSSLMAPNAQIFASPLLRQIIFSVTNNFVGLGAFSMEEVLLFLQKESDLKVYQLISQAPEYSAEAFVENTFKGAVEAGDARIADLLLTQKFVHIDINKRIYPKYGDRCSPLEAAITSQNSDVIEVLLKHHADVSQANSESERKILDLAIRPYRKYSKSAFDRQIFSMLVDAGGNLSARSMRWDLLEILRQRTASLLTTI